uniref:Uncharacterized protein n=1 Tax=Anopheles epiroticus TaxID=199890 RepID=A0A182NZI7_9DIPT
MRLGAIGRFQAAIAIAPNHNLHQLERANNRAPRSFDGYLCLDFRFVLDTHTTPFTKFIKTGIADKNDYPLYFEKVIYEADIDENVEINHNFLNVTAKTHGEGEYHGLV